MIRLFLLLRCEEDNHGHRDDIGRSEMSDLHKAGQAAAIGKILSRYASMAGAFNSARRDK